MNLVKEMVRNYSGTKEYRLVLDELLALKTAKHQFATDENDYAKIELGVNELGNYICSRMVDMLDHISSKKLCKCKSEDFLKYFGFDS